MKRSQAKTVEVFRNLFILYNLTSRVAHESSREIQRKAWFPDAQCPRGGLSTAVSFKHKMKYVITMFPLQSPSKSFNRNGESGVLMQRTCENTDCKF